MCTSLVAIYLWITGYRLLLQSSWDSPETWVWKVNLFKVFRFIRHKPRQLVWSHKRSSRKCTRVSKKKEPNWPKTDSTALKWPQGPEPDIILSSIVGFLNPQFLMTLKLLLTILHRRRVQEVCSLKFLQSYAYSDSRLQVLGEGMVKEVFKKFALF